MIRGMWCCDACPKRTESASVLDPPEGWVRRTVADRLIEAKHAIDSQRTFHLCSDCAPSFALPFYPKAAQDGAES